MMKFYRNKVLSCLVSVLLLWGCHSKKIGKLVCISQSARHPALDQTAEGIVQGLTQEGWEQGKNITVEIQCAQGNPSLASQIAAKFYSQKPDIVIGVGTLSAQSLYAGNHTVPLLYASVTDPLSAGLIGKNARTVTGFSNFVPIAPNLALLRKVKPNLKVLGIVCNLAEKNSVIITEKWQALCAQEHIKLVPFVITKAGDVPQVCSRLAPDVDFVLVDNDNTALACVPSIVKSSAPTPVWVSDTDIVHQGALLAQGPDQKNLGVEVGKLASDILKGKDLSQLSVQYPTQTHIYLNQKAASALGLTFPKDLTSHAQKIIE